MSNRIRWESDGKDGFEGYVGTLEPWAFQMWQSPCDTGDYVLGSWVLLAAFPRADGMRSVARDNPDELKVKAERWLEEFISSLGAVFPPGPVISRCECGGLASHQHGCRWRQGYGSLIEAVTDEPAKEAAQ